MTEGDEDLGGILLEYVPGPTLRDLPHITPPVTRDLLVPLCEEAVEVVRRMHDYEVLLRDLRLDNSIIASISPPRVVLIDFAQCFLRSERAE